MFKLNPHNRIRPHTWSKSHRLGELETEAYARTVELSQAGRERTLTRFVQAFVPDPDDEIVEYGGIEAWAGEEDDELVPERMPDDPDDEPRDEAWEIASLAEFLWSQTPAEEIAWADDVGADDEHDLDFEAWTDEDDDNWALLSMSPLAQFGEGARHYCRPYVDKHPGRKAVRKSWTRRHPRKLPFHGVTEADVSIMETLCEQLVLAVVEGIMEILDERAAA